MHSLNNILKRETQEADLKEKLLEFEKYKDDITIKRGFFIYGNPGVGKTYFVNEVLLSLNYDIITYDAGDIRNKSIIETISAHNMANKNVLSLLNNKPKKIAIVMDELDGMNNGDKGGINSLIKLIRPKKTKKQKMEEICKMPIICIGNCHIDKKIKELMKVCYNYELLSPTEPQLVSIIEQTLPDLKINIKTSGLVINYVQGDLRKVFGLVELYKSNFDIFKRNIICNILHEKTFTDDAKEITKKLLNNSTHLNDHNYLINETDRTIISLLFHENIIDILQKFDKDESFPFYRELLHNMCFGDYMDRITFQKQIWQLNEMTSLVKTLYNSHLLNNNFNNKSKSKVKFNPSEVRFTKVLTKYSTEYNNNMFIQNLCQQLQMDKKDMILYFRYLRVTYPNEEDVYNLFENYEINKLDINRIYRFIDKNHLIESE
jgi:hypothetical protein